jgi:hypothetical protein
VLKDASMLMTFGEVPTHRVPSRIQKSLHSALRPIQITYYGITSKSYSQQYSATDPAGFSRTVNLLDAPVFGTIKLAWNGDTLSNLSINGDLPPSVDDSVVFDPKGYISREVVEAARYSVRIDASLVKGTGTTRADLSNFQLGYVPTGQTASSITVDFLPTGQASFIEIPTQNNPTCIDINKTGFSLGLNITSPEGSASGNLKAASGCGTGSQVAENGIVELKGQVKLKNDAGNLLDLVDATIGLSVTNKIPTVKIEGVLGLPNRAPLNLVISVTQERAATPTLTGITSASIGYTQGGYVVSFTGIQEENCFFSKSNLLKYMYDARIEYQKQEQIYNFDICICISYEMEKYLLVLKKQIIKMI